MILLNFCHRRESKSGQFWYPNHLQKAFINNQKDKTVISEDLFKSSICLPSSYSLTKKEILYISKLITSYAKKN